MIQIYKHENTNFEANGDMTLTPTSSIFKMELNGICEIELEHPYDKLGRWKCIVADNVISGPTPYSEKQLFRIHETEKTMTGIKAYARHIFFDLIDSILLDVRPTQKTGEEALNILLQGTEYKGHSNLVDLNTAYYIRKNVVEAICGDDENSFVNRWGGERLYDNFDIYINSCIGADNGVRAEFGYNLTEIEEKINLEDTVTRIIPLGYNGIMLDGDKPWVDSPSINKYAKTKTKVVEMSDIKVKENADDEEGYDTLEEAQNAMKQRCKELFEGGLDLPTCTYSVAMEDLSSTTAYKGYEVLETVSIGDTVHCKHIGLGIETKARCVALEWNMLSKKYVSLTLGDVTKSFFDEQSDVATRIDNILNENGTVNANKLQGIVDGLNTKFKAQKDIAQKQDVRAILFEDLDPDSPTFGATAIGTVGLEIANKRNATNTDWEWNTFITAGLVYADRILTGVLTAILIKSLDGRSWFNLSTGELVLGKGKIIVNNQNDEKVMWVDENGHLATDTLEVFGDSSSTVSFHGKGAKAINFKSDDAKDLFINFWRGTDTKTRIGIYKAEEGGSDRSYQFFIEPGSTTKDNEPMVIIRGANSTSEKNEMSILQVQGDIQAIRDLIIGSSSAGNRINVREEIESLKVRLNNLESK